MSPSLLGRDTDDPATFQGRALSIQPAAASTGPAASRPPTL